MSGLCQRTAAGITIGSPYSTSPIANMSLPWRFGRYWTGTRCRRATTRHDGRSVQRGRMRAEQGSAESFQPIVRIDRLAVQHGLRGDVTDDRAERVAVRTDRVEESRQAGRLAEDR